MAMESSSYRGTGKVALLYVPVGRVHVGDLMESQFLGQPVLVRAEHPLGAAPGLGGIGGDHLDAHLLHGASELGRLGFIPPAPTRPPGRPGRTSARAGQPAPVASGAPPVSAPPPPALPPGGTSWPRCSRGWRRPGGRGDGKGR